jgi:hypothetical protein
MPSFAQAHAERKAERERAGVAEALARDARQQSAFHEACHAVAAAVVGVPIDYIALSPAHCRLRLRECDRAVGGRLGVELGVTYAAGIAANFAWAPDSEPVDLVTASDPDSDVTAVVSEAARLAGVSGSDVVRIGALRIVRVTRDDFGGVWESTEALTRAAARILKLHQSAVHALTRALLASERIPGPRALQIIGPVTQLRGLALRSAIETERGIARSLRTS